MDGPLPSSPEDLCPREVGVAHPLSGEKRIDGGITQGLDLCGANVRKMGVGGR